MAFLSPLKKSDVSLLQDKAIELGCKVSYLEKDYYLVHLIRCLQEVPINNGNFIFTGGTALAKGYKLIERFSEDCDFIFLSPDGRRPYLSTVKDKIKNHLQNYGFLIKNVVAKNNNKNMEFEVGYPSLSFLSEGKEDLRSELKLEVIYKENLLTQPKKSFVQSFLSESKSGKPEVDGVECLSIEEIATGKLSALVWRTLDKNKENDPRLIRHLYDLASLDYHLSASQSFRDLCLPVIIHDLQERARPPLEFPKALQMIIQELQANPIHQKNYQDYLANFIYGPLSDNRLAFGDAINKLTRLLQSLKL